MNSCLTKRMRPHTLLLLALGALVLGFASSGCVYRLAIQQGNFLDPAQVEQLKAGMTRAQVRFLLGTPMLPDAFNHDRWDYLYYLKAGRIKQTIERRLTVWFENDKVARFENLGIPAPTSAANSADAAPSIATSPPDAPTDASPKAPPASEPAPLAAPAPLAPRAPSAPAKPAT